MRDAGTMSCRQRVKDLDGTCERTIDGQRTFLQAIGQRLSLQILHHEIGRTVVYADVVQSANVRMIEF